MILGAALLVLVALGLFAGGIATGATAFYWACVAVSVLAAVLLVAARRGAGRGPAGAAAGGSAAPEPVARHRAPEADDGRVPPPDQEESLGTVGAATAGTGGERAGGPAGLPAEAPVVADGDGEPPVEEVEVPDLLLVVDLRDEVLVVDEHPRYHVAGCPWLAGRTTVPLPLDEARTDGFTPCGRCTPDRHLARVERARRAERRAT